MDPRVRLALLGCAGVFALVLDRPASLGLLAAGCAVPFAFLAAGRRFWREGLGAVLALVWGTALSQGLFYADEPRVPLVVVGPVVVWREGLVHGLVQSLRLVSVALAGLAVAASTPPDRLYAALLRLRVPWGVAFLAATSLRFLPETVSEIASVRSARSRRGRPVHDRPPWEWLALEVALLRPVVARSLRRAHALAESLDARGFDPLAPRAVRRPLRIAAWEVPVLALALGSTGAAVAVRLLFVLYTSEVAWFPRLRPLYGFVREWM